MLTGEAPTILGTSSDLWGQLYDVVRQADCSAGAVLGGQTDCSAGAVLGGQADCSACAVLGRSGCAKATSEATAHLRCSTSLLVGSKLDELLDALMPQGAFTFAREGANSAVRRRSLRACLKWFQNVTVHEAKDLQKNNQLRDT
jgi:hypothetical protein